MTYVLLSIPFVAAAAVVALCARRRLHIAALIATAAALVTLTAIFDNLMIVAGFFHYADEHLAGPRLLLAPIEDFAYPLTAALLLPAVWSLLSARREGRTGRS